MLKFVVDVHVGRAGRRVRICVARTSGRQSTCERARAGQSSARGDNELRALEFVRSRRRVFGGNEGAAAQATLVKPTTDRKKSTSFDELPAADQTALFDSVDKLKGDSKARSRFRRTFKINK